MTEQDSTSAQDDVRDRIVWILVDNSSRAQAFESVAEFLSAHNVRVEIVTITEMTFSMARDALAGSAERVLRALRVATNGRPSDEDLIGAVRRGRPHMLAVTNSRYVRALSLLESLTGIQSLQVGVLPDYNLDDQWLRSGLHAFIVPHDAQAQRLRRQGVDVGRVMVAGPPVARGWTKSVDKALVRESFGFSAKERIVLVRADAFSIGDLDRLMFQCNLVEGNVRFIFHHNGDGACAGALRRAANTYGLNAIMFGKVHDLERYCGACDAVVAVPNDPMMAEIISQGKPVMLVGPEQGAQDQVEFLVNHDMGRHVSDLLRLGSELERFLSGESLDAMTQAAESIGLPDGSKEVAEAIVDALKHAQAWQRAPRDTPQDDGNGGDTEGKEEPKDSAFESIGKHAPEGSKGDGSGGSGSSPAFDGISQAEAKEQMAQLILQEREMDRRLGDLEKEQTRWRNRLDMAREWQEQDLEEEAQAILKGYIDEANRIQQDLGGLRQQKDKLRAAAQSSRRGSTPTGKGAEQARNPALAKMEKRFRKMEENRDLSDLKDKLRRDFGDED